MKVKKDNLTDLVSDLTQPKPNVNQAPQIKPPSGLNDYQVITPDGVVIDLTLTVTPTMLQKVGGNTNIKKILEAKDKKGNQYILIVQAKAT